MVHMDAIAIAIVVNLFLLLGLLVYYYTRKPNHHRDWTEDQQILPSISTYGGLITIHNVRNATYKSKDDYDVRYYDKTFKVGDLESLWLIIEPFGPKLPFNLRAAHVFVSLGLADGSFVSISVEIRKKKGDSFSTRGALNGLLRYYELMYVVADEKDVIQLRTNHREDDVLLYPLDVSKEISQNIFLDFAKEINELYEKPSFFHTITDNCTTILVRNLRKNGIQLPRWNLSYISPAYIDTLFYTQGLIKTNLSLKDARDHFHITKKAQAVNGSSDFSNHIRAKI